VPGPINSAKSAGCNKLIHDNLAIPALSAQSILSDLGLREEIRFSEEKRKPTFAKENDRLLYEALSHEPIQVDALSEATNIDISEILVKLLEFEFNGWVRQLPGKYYVIT
jgi:DNA processing protein